MVDMVGQVDITGCFAAGRAVRPAAFSVLSVKV